MKLRRNTRRHSPRTAPLLLLAILMLPIAVQAHFQQLIPSQAIVDGAGARQISLELVFTHPMAGGPAMEMATPVRFGVQTPTAREDLLSSLQRRQVDGSNAFRTEYRFTQPGDHIFYLEPAPYWEPAEGKMIIHYTKVVVDAFGGPDGWDKAIDFPVEIEPLVRPYGLWSGNLFRGIVKKNGQPVPFAEIEVEWRNDGTLRVPADAFITQKIKADAQGTFSYAMPRAGWWGFAALLEADQPMLNPAGSAVPAELGALIWVRTIDMNSTENGRGSHP